MAKKLVESWKKHRVSEKMQGVHILLTYRCIFECDHCFVWSSPDSTGTMTLSDIRKILNEAKDADIKTIYFEGGESFLYYPILVQGVREALDRGFRVGVTASCYWATAVEDAVVWLEPLKGISGLELSGDPYHGNVKDTEYGVIAARKLGIPVSIISIDRPGGPKEVEGVKVGYYELMYRGRAVSKLAPDAKKKAWREFDECPYEDLEEPERVHIDPFGWVHVCQGITIGNINEKKLSEIIAGYDPHTHPIIGPLIGGGPRRLVERFGLSCVDSYADGCHLCYEARLLLRDQFPDILAPVQVYGV